MWLVLTSFLLVPWLAKPVSAQTAPALRPAPYASPKVGTRFHWRDVDSSEVGVALIRATDGVKRRWEFDGTLRETIPFCTGCTEAGMIFPFEDYIALWPLEVGKTVEFRRMLEGDAWRNRVEVVGTESVDLEFGSVDVYVIDVESRGVTFDVKTWRRRSRVWYAPSLSSAVRLQTTFDHGRLNEHHVTRWELVGLDPP